MFFRSKLFRKGLLSLLILGSFLNPGLAQDAGKSRKPVEFRGFASFGIQWPDIGDLNNVIKPHGFSEFSRNFYTIGGFGHVILNNKVIIGGGGYGLARKQVIRGDVMAALSGGVGLFEVGYVIISKGNIKVYPMLGIGGGDLSLRITGKTSASFEEILENPKRPSLLSNRGVLIDLSVGTDYFVKTNNQADGAGGLVFGFRFGYAFSPGWDKWQMNNLDIFGGPKIGLTGPYIRFIFGGGRKVF